MTIMSHMWHAVFLVVLLSTLGNCLPNGRRNVVVLNVETHPVIPNNNSVYAAQINSLAIETVAKISCKGPNITGCDIGIPSGMILYIHPILLSGYNNVRLSIEGELRAQNNISAWPRDSSNNTLDVLTVEDCNFITLAGPGKIDGQGYDWWWYAIVGGFTKAWRDHRPHLVHFRRTQTITVENIRLINSPQYHIKLDDCADLIVRHMVIWVDVEKQKSLLRENGLLETSVGTTADGRKRVIEIPIFPLNTDGIDPAVAGAHIYNVTIENFDDAVAVKPCSDDPARYYCGCSADMLIENSTVRFGVGMTIGSVPPNENVNCVQNITFRNIYFHEPLKAVYIKTNPGNSGFGTIKEIKYENLTIVDPVWWGIYIGPQQQDQPDGSGPGCMTYPIQSCPTQPRVPMYNITLRDISMSGGVNPFAGVVRCNATRPCTGFLFENIHVKETPDTENYIVEFVYGKAIKCSPSPDFASNSTGLKMFPPVHQEHRFHKRRG